MSLHRCLIPTLLVLLIGAAHGEESLQLSQLLESPPGRPAENTSSAPSPKLDPAKLIEVVSLPPRPEFAPVPPPPALPDLPDMQQASSAPRALSAQEQIIEASRKVKDDQPRIPFIDLTTPPDDLWQRMRHGFAMPDLASPLVADREAWYLSRPDLLAKIFERGRMYLHHIVGELEKRGMPTELALLPIVESSFNPLAYSSARALGMWQFIPSTGKSYNLQQNWWFDQRRDIVASTNAALDYLQYIYEMHGDWHLALASYNWGENAVARAIAKNQAKGLPTDYQNLKMPDETRYYVPKLQAIKNIIAQPQLFGISIDPIPNRPFFGIVERNGKMDVALAARLAEIPLDEFIALNPAYNRPVMPSEADSPLVLPTEKIQTYLDNLQDHQAQAKPLTAWHSHKLKRGETLNSVAKRYGISATRLKQLNGINRRTRVRPGFTLLVPDENAIARETIGASLPKTPTKPPRASKKKSRKVSKTRNKRKSTAKKTSKPATKSRKQ